MTGTPPVPTFSTPMPQACAEANKEARIVVAATPPPTEYLGEITQPTTVLVAVAIDGDGSVLSTKIYKSSGNAKLDNAAITAARRSTYSPKVADCNPTRADYLFRVLFTPPSPSPSPTPMSKIPAHR